MADHHHIVDEIRTFLQSSDQTQSERIKELARQYTAACQEANQRLRRCADFLRRGLRPEAIHLAQQEPLLLEVVGLLDFPERKQWDDLCTFYDLQVPPALQLDTAAALNEAYADDQPIEDLLRKHRLMALSRTSLGPRLNVLRRIAQMDALNPVWQDDVRDYEKARLRQLPTEVGSAIQQKDATRLLALSEELLRTKWLVPLPPSLVQQVQTATRQSVQARSVAALQGLEGQLYEAMNAFDLARAQALRGEWDQLAAGIDRAAHADLFDRAGTVFSWIDEQLRRQAEEQKLQYALGELDSALNSRAPRDVLVDLAGKAQDLGGLPDGMHMRVQARLQEIDRAATRRRILLVAGPLAAVALIAAGVVFVMQRQAESARIEAAQKHLLALVDNKQLGEARQYLQELSDRDPATRQLPAITELEARLLRLEKDDRDRQYLFQEALKAARAAPLGPTGEEAVVIARNRAGTPEERATVAQLAEDRQTRWDQQVQARDQGYLTRAAEIRASVQAMEDLARQADEAQKAAGMVFEQQARLDRLLTDATDGGPEVRKQLDALNVRIEAVRQTLGKQNKELGLMQGLSVAAGVRPDPERYRQAVASYVKDFGETDRGKDLKQVVEETPLWQAAQDWGALIKPHLSDLLDLTPEEAKRRSGECRRFLEKYPQHPDAGSIDSYIKFLDALRQREETGQATAASELKSAFAGLLVKDLKCLTARDVNNNTLQKLYFVTRDVDLEGMAKTAPTNFLRFSYLASYDGKEKPAQIRLDAIVKIAPAAQSVLAAEVRKEILPLRDPAWDKALIALAQKVKDAAEVDSVLRMILLRQVLECAGKGSYPLHLALPDYMDRLDKAEVDLTVAWMDPENKTAPAARTAAKEFLDRFPKLDRAVDDAETIRKGVAAEVTRSYTFSVGWLMREKDRRWRLDRDTLDLPGRYELLVLLPGADQKSSWQVVGSIDMGKTTVDLASRKEALVEGRWVFARKIGP